MVVPNPITKVASPVSFVKLVNQTVLISQMNHSHSALDHSMMDHSAMDHSSMDHSVMNDAPIGNPMETTDHPSMTDMMMMVFHFGCEERVLFSWWHIRDTSTMIFSVIGIIVISALYEGLKYYREHLLWQTYNALQYRAVEETAVVNEEAPKTVIRQVTRKEVPRMLSRKHGLQTILHAIQLTVSYLLMLIFMTFNVWLCIAVVVGSAIGYFLFGWKRTVVVDVTENCH